MLNEPFIIAGTKIEKNSDVLINIDLPKLYNTPTELPIRVIRGKKKWSCCLYQCGYPWR